MDVEPPVPVQQSPLQNRLLAALPAETYARLLPDLGFVPLALGQVIYESGGLQTHLFFPTTSIVSLLYVTEGAESTEIAIVGNEGAVGVTIFMGGDTTSSRAVVQSAGQAYRIEAGVMMSEFARGGDVQRLLLLYTQAMITQMAQTVVCNRYHGIDQQLCRWLLLSMDRLPANELTMTKGLIANMLGARREGMIDAVDHLRSAGLIHYSKGTITILDRLKLEQRACECYAVVKREYDRLLPLILAPLGEPLPD